MVPVTARQNLVQLGVYGLVVLSTVIGAIILGWQGTLDSAAVTAIFGAAVGFAGGSAASGSTLFAVVNGKSVVTPQLLAEQGATTRTSIIAAAGSQAQTVTPVEPSPTTPPE